ncbi:MAG: nucleoside deaminase, partial [Pseudomonadota bacterium]
QIISKAYNLVEKNNDPTNHAEMLVIRDACNKLASKFLYDYDIYITLQPCLMCYQAILYAKIKRLYFGAYDSASSLKVPSSNHKIEIYGGIEEEKCKSILNDFFLQKR